ncbi:MAG: tetratricopeptide repeat protein [Bacteroidetes bacterium]|nr:tetratricopeptide repeat protein [Bacteroidota bacterium]
MMKYLLRNLFFLSFYFFVQIAAAQEDKNEQLALQYYARGEFDKASDLYEKLFDKNPDDFNYYEHYLECLLNLKDFKTAERLVKRQIRRVPQELQFRVDLGKVYKSADDLEKAKKEFESVIATMPPDQNQVINLARYFIDMGEMDFAMKTYLRGRKLVGSSYNFYFEMAELYFQKGDYENMIREYLDVLALNTIYLQNVQNALQTSIGEDEGGKKNKILKTQLLKRIQTSLDNSVYSEMLIWLYVQERDFESAFMQSKALDKRQHLDGSKIMALATLASSNKDYDVASKCYQYIIEQGKANAHYTTARMELVTSLNAKIVNNPAYTPLDLAILKRTYLSTLTELGKSPATLPLLRGLAHLEAFYLYDADSAIGILNEAITYQRADPKTIAECKLELADILLFTGEIWETTLLYSQVEKAFKEEPIGQEAKFRNARLSYYHGDFEWSRAQLNVLKSSTAKLIANDALDLSLLISDNTVDSNFVPLEMYARADLLVYQNKDSFALLTLDSITKQFPTHAIDDEILFKKYQIEFKRGKFETAAAFLQEIRDKYSTDILGDDAVFKLAELNQYHLKNQEKAKELYQELLTNYPGSLYTVEARKRFRLMRGDTFVN